MRTPSWRAYFRVRNTRLADRRFLTRMDLIHDIEPLRQRIARDRSAGAGLVPTMGNLHQGHLELVRACRESVGLCVVSIFVNPTQFGPDEDFVSYPRTLAEDMRLLEAEGADVVFAPTADVMYPDGQQGHATISVPALADTLCGTSRVGHFDGVATVVAKLFNIAQPDKAFFGEKDWQQLTLIRAMVRQLDMPLEVVGVPTVRAASGLALSSRNKYLSPAELDLAPHVSQCLHGIADAIAGGDRDYRAAEYRGTRQLTVAGFQVEYVAVRDAERLTTPDDATTHLRILAAARLGRARLIDNVGVVL